MVEPSLGWRQLTAEARSERQRNFAVCVSQPWAAPGSTRDPITRRPIDAHSAAVAAVHAAAPATCRATKPAGTPVKNCTDPHVP